MRKSGAAWHDLQPRWPQLRRGPVYRFERQPLKQSIEYLRELRAGDVVEIRSSIIGLGEKVLTLRQTMTNGEDGSTAATQETVAVHLDTQLRKAIAFPEAVVAVIRVRFPGVTPMTPK